MSALVTEIFETCAGFAQALRRAGVAAIGTEDFLTGLSTLDPTRRDDVYWAGRSTLCASPEDLPAYDRVFADWFERSGGIFDEEVVEIVPLSPSQADGAEGELATEENEVLYAASRRELLKQRDVQSLSEDEQRQLAELFGSLAVALPRRRTRRYTSSHRDAIDVRATVREQLRAGGELAIIRHRRPVYKQRRVVFLIDVSRSMEPYADYLLRLAHAVHRKAPRFVEVFTMGTRLTRVTRALDPADPERALQCAGDAIPDWSGGTRLADGIGAFTDSWGRHGMARQAVVVIASDGWERGDTAPLAKQTERLSRLAHRIIWVNPHSGKPGYEPVQAGIAAVLPHINQMVAGHSFHSFTRLLEVIADV